MRRIAPLIIGLLLFPGLAARGDDGVVLFGLGKEERLTATRLELQLSAIPKHRLEVSGQRLDLFLSGTRIAPSVRLFPEDGEVLRTLLGHHPQESVVSFVLRQVPASVKVLTQEEPPRLLVDIDWAKGAPRPAMTLAPRRTEASAYAGDWRRFFSALGPPLRIPVPPRYTLPPLPPLRYEPREQGPLGEGIKGAFVLAAGEDWPACAELLRGIPGGKLQGLDSQALGILLGEALLRSGAPAEALPVLEDFLARHGDSSLLSRARFLLGYARAATGEPYGALVEIAPLATTAPAYYQACAALLRAELYLGGGDGEKAGTALADSALAQAAFLGVSLPLRRADHLAATGRYGEALAAYDALNLQEEFWINHPFSLSFLAESRFQAGDGPGAAKAYGVLAMVLAGQKGEALAGFAAARSAGGAEGRQALASVQARHPGSEGALRARLRLADLNLIEAGQGDISSLAGEFRLLAGVAPNRDLREEATFKALLVQMLAGEKVAAAQALETFLREFGAGRLSREGRALLAELIPAVVAERVEKGEELEALALVERHRDLLAAGSLSPELLLEIGGSFERLGLLAQAEKVYGHLIEAAAGHPSGAGFYLPRTRVLLALADYPRAADCAAAYLERHPTGGDAREMLFLRCRALYGGGRGEEAAALLEKAGPQSELPVNLFAGRLFWELGRYGEVERFLARAMADAPPGGIEPQAILWRAEALWRGGRRAEALPLYQLLLESEAFADQALYRTAQIAEAAGRRQEALKLLTRLAEKGKDPRWQQVALQGQDGKGLPEL